MSSATSDDEDQVDITCGANKKAAPENNTEDIPVPPANIPQKKGAVSELSVVEARWFHRSSKNATWIPFKGRDSLLIEVKRRLELDLSIFDNFTNKIEILSLCNKSIVVLDGYYELFYSEMKVKPIYWEGDAIDIMRGSWFFDNDWSPLDEELANEIEKQHLKMFRGQNIPDTPVYTEKGQKPILHTMISNNCKIEWNSIIDVTLQPTSRTWMMSLRLKSNITKIRRSYHTEATYSDGPTPINHIIFVVHGIGQKRQVNQIVMNCNCMRSISDRIIKAFKDLEHRPIFIPVEWRTNLKLDEDIIDAITPNHVQFVRALLNTTAMDIMYYSSPKYRAEVSAGLVAVFNRLYALFLRHNSYFESINGKVSIVAHSLGSVISYDVITNWSPLKQYEEFVTQRLQYLIGSNLFGLDAKNRLRNLQTSRNELEEKEGGFWNLLNLADAEKMRLLFKVSNLFCLGSPLSVFLALRGQRGLQVLDHFSPTLFNIYNTSDPVAYRIEPLVHPLYAKINPLRIHRYDSKNQIPYQEMPKELIKPEAKRRKSTGKSPPIEIATAVVAVSSPVLEEKADSGAESGSTADKDKTPKRSWSAAVLSKFRGTSLTVATETASGSGSEAIVVAKTTVALNSASATFGSVDSLDGQQQTGSGSAAVPPQPVTVNHVTDSDPLNGIPDTCKLPYRFDYVLKEGKLENAVLSTVTAHTNYWQKSDVVMFILAQLYGVPTTVGR